ncbi:TIR domain-containing protein [Sphingomonas piscis]|uniref:TIR domain-containing protein n=1 Tax=Sphingomonas piscis TaxID=2714943 RepID=A0A6G7YQN6_9SPHN|nr:TIR domain-containing protein [Sphingomonas piscis]
MKIKRRRVFFSFHFQRDGWRANQIRQSWRFGNEATRAGTGFFDGSLWESAQRKDDASLKALINTGLENTSVTCVLAGTETYARRWVRFEIAKSVARGNGLLTVWIDQKRDPNGLTCARGPDPLGYMGVYLAEPGKIYLAEYHSGRWQRYLDYRMPVQLPSSWRAPTSSNVIPLHNYARNHCYVTEGGSTSFAMWIEAAAQSVGR